MATVPKAPAKKPEIRRWTPPQVRAHKGENVGLCALIYGPQGSGKTTLGFDCHSEGGKSLLIAADGNYRALKRDDEPDVIDVKSWKDFEHVVQNMDFEPYDTVVVDTLGMISQYAQDHVCKEFGVAYPEAGPGRNGGAVWNRMGIIIGTTIAKLTMRARNTLFLAHEMTLEVRNSRGVSVKKLMSDLKTTMGRRAQTLVSLVGHLEFTKDGERVINFQGADDLDAKDTAQVFKEKGFTVECDGRMLYDLVVGQ